LDCYLEWLGGRDSNPDTQIQSLSKGEANKQDQQLRPAKRGKGWQNPQDSRKRAKQRRAKVEEAKSDRGIE
jgi:hypothetical protein